MSPNKRRPVAFAPVPPALPRPRTAGRGDLPAGRAACGMGFVSTPELGHQAVALGVRALARLAHRGGLDADGKSGDGAGLLIQVPQRLLGGQYGVAALFEWDGRGRQVVEGAVAAGGMRLVARRGGPLAPHSRRTSARGTKAPIWARRI